MKRLIISATILMLITGCAVNKPAPKSNPNLPKVSEFKAYPDRNAMALFWSPVNNIEGYYIQRYNEKNKKWIQLATIKDPFKSIYIDKKLKPNTTYKYRIATFKNNIPSLAIETTQKTLPPMMPVIPLEAKPLTKGIVKIVFRPHPNERVVKYIIERFNDEKAKWEEIATLNHRMEVEYIDKGLQDGKIYKYRIFAISYDRIKSLPSKNIVVSTYPKPPIVLNIKATINLPKQIKLTWSPVQNAKYYKIYTSDFANGPFNFYKKVTKTEFTDYLKEDGAKRYYKVTAVSPHNTESLLNETPAVMGQTLPKPTTPIVSTNLFQNKVEFVFTSPDNRAAKYLIIKEEKEGVFKKSQKKFVVNKNSFQDTITPKKRYTYYIYEVDKYGLISKEPAKVEIGG